jgi:hypothetical protein
MRDPAGRVSGTRLTMISRPWSSPGEWEPRLPVRPERAVSIGPLSGFPQSSPHFTRIHVERLGSRRDATQSTQEDGHDQTTTGRYHPNSAENGGRLGSSPPGASAEVRTPPCRDDAPSTPPAPTVPHALAAKLRGCAPDCVLGTSEARGPGSPGRRCPISCPPARFHATNA